MNSWLKKVLAIFAVFVLLASQSELAVLAATETNDSQVEEETTENNIAEERLGEEPPAGSESPNPPAGRQMLQSSYAFAAFDGNDLAGSNALTYDVRDAEKNSRTLDIKASFDGSPATTDRKIIIRIQNGLMFTAIQGMTPNADYTVWTYNGVFPSHISGITNATFTPDAPVYGYQPKSGTLVYEIAPGTTKVTLSPQIAFDLAFGGNDGSRDFTDIISVQTSAKLNGTEQILNEEKLETYTITGIVQMIFYAVNGANGEVKKYVDAGDTVSMDYFLSTHGISYTNSFSNSVLFDKQVYTFTLDKALGFQSITSPDNSLSSAQLSYSVDSTSDEAHDIVTMTLANFKDSGQKVSLNFKVQDTATPGTYSVHGIPTETRYYGNATPAVTGTVHMQKIIVSSTFENKLLTIGSSGTIYPSSDATNELLPLGVYSVFNDFSKTVTDQKIRLTFNDPTIGVRWVSLVTGYNKPATNIVIKTEQGKEITLESVNSRNINERTGTAAISLASFADVAADDYIIEITYESTDFLSGSGRGDGGVAVQYVSWANLPGVFKGVIRNVPPSRTYSATLQSVAATEDFSSADTQSAPINMTIANQPGYIMFQSRISNLASQPYLAGSSTTITGSFNLSTAGTQSLKRGFDVYLREGEYFYIDPESIIVSWDGNTYTTANGGISVADGVDNLGFKTLKIALPDVMLGYSKPDGSNYPYVDIQYKIKISNTAPTTSINASELMMILPNNDTKVQTDGNFAYYNNNNKFNVDGSGDLTKKVGTISKDLTFKIQTQKDFTVTTAANLNDGPWVSYDYVANRSIIDLNPVGVAKYRLSVTNNSGSDIVGYTALIPIPKSGEKTDLTPANAAEFNINEHLQKEAFTWTASIANQLNTSNAQLNYQVLYATSYETNKDSAAFVSWDAIANKDDIRMVKVVTTDTIADGFNESLVMNLALTDPAADAHAGNINIYSARIHRDILGNAGYKPSEPIAIRLKTGVVSGVVFNDTNRDGIQNNGESGRNGVTVTAYEKGTTNKIESTVTANVNGKDGVYNFFGLDKNQDVDIVFTNPNTDDSLRFSPKTANGSTAAATTDHASAITSGITPSSTNSAAVDAGLITPTVVTMNVQGGSTAEAVIKRYPGASIDTEPAAVKTGYTFNGWFTAATGGSKVSFPYVVGTTDTTLYAQYLVNSYTASFNIIANGGEGAAPAVQSVNYGAAITEPTVPSKTGYTFAGWYDAASGGTKWNFSTATMPAADLTLYAQFSINSYVVTFDNEGETMTQSVVYNTPVNEPAAPSKTGYTFTGWYTAPSGGTKWNFSTATMPANAMTLYARYTVNTYTLTFNDQGTTAASTVYYGATITEPLTTPVKPGYTFSGWYDAASGGNKWNFAAGTMPARDLTLYARFTAVNQTITFNINGGDAASKPLDVIQPTDSLVDLDAVVAPIKAGYAFIGWYDAADVQYSGTFPMPVGGLSLKAKWTATNQVINFNSAGGSGVDSMTAPTDTVVDISSAVPSRAGYSFDGWYDATETQYSGAFSMPAGGLTLIAHWTALDQTISFDVNGGDAATTPADIVAPTDSIVDINAIAAPTWFGHKFLGWYSEEAQIFGTINMPAGGLTLKAHWQDLIAEGVWQISADNIEMKLTEVNSFIQSGTFKDEVLARSNAQAWNAETNEILTPLTLELDSLLYAPNAGAYIATISYQESNAVSNATNVMQLFTENEAIALQENASTSMLTTSFTVTVVDDTPKVLPITGNDGVVVGAFTGSIAMALSGWLFFLRKKRKDNGEA